MKKVGIITILKVNNYGAELQAFALHRKLQTLGVENEVIDYLYYKHPDYKFEREAAPMVPISLKNRIKGKLLKIYERTAKYGNFNSAKRREERFAAFHAKNTKLSSTYKSISALYNAKHPYDVFVVGSDQVWNPITQVSLKPYFLTFAPKDKKKISYASSFGVSQIAESDKIVYRDCLNNLDVLSCREKQGVNIIKELTAREATHVLDPTLLLSAEEWSKVAVPVKDQRPYILMYVLTHSPYITKLALHLSELTGYRIVRLCKSPMKEDRGSVIENITDAGPAEYLGYFQNASFVLTNSFHGTVFSIINKKPFYIIAPAKKTNNSRQRGLLELVDLENRLINEGAEFPAKENLAVDFTMPHEVLEKEKEKSIQYLLSAINN
ncbi:MAG: polysaccharide pyruvyl transferase family protein [Bacteroidota bacterium]|nr:polysaccharide pyruvyl transferase family protein [Bacteroidota bacterium]